jgi:Domain of unknown function (DUF4249)
MPNHIEKRVISRVVIHTATFVLLLGCLGQIDIRTLPRGNQLVVSGQVSTIQDRNLVQLGKTAETGRLPFPVEGAIVTLFDDTGSTYIYNEDYEHPGDYRLNDFSGSAARRYHIQIILPTGETYESIPERMPEATGRDSVFYEFQDKEFTDLGGTVTTQPFLEIYTNTTLSEANTPTYIRWSVEECYVIRPTDYPDPFGNVPPPCYVTQKADPQRVVLLNGTTLKTTFLEHLSLASRLADRSFYDRHYFTTYNSSLTEEAYEYWRKVNILANQVGSIFDTPPAAITGNIFRVNDPNETVLGYFEATNQTYSRFYLVNGDLPFQLQYQSCTFDPARRYDDYPRECLDCLTVRNSSYVRPDWF